MDRKSKLIHAAGRSYAAKEMRQYFGFASMGERSGNSKG